MSYKHLFITGLILCLPWSVSASGWTQKDDGSLQAIRAFDSTNGVISAAGNTGYRMYSQNNGDTWEIPERAASNWWYAMDSTDDKSYLVGSGGAYATSDDHGVTWQSASIGATTNLYDVEMANNYGYIVGASGTAYYYANNNWNVTATGTAKDILAVQNMGDATGWAVTAEGWLYYITGGGIGWTQKGKVANNHLNDVFFSDGSSGWVIGDAATIRYTGDAGSSWIDVDVEGLTTQDLYSIAVDGDEMVIAGEEVLLYSDDAGATWEVSDFSNDNYEFRVAYADEDGQFWVAGTNDDVSSVIMKMTEAPQAPSHIGYWTLLDDGLDDLDLYWGEAEDADSTDLTYYLVLDDGEPINVGSETEYTWEEVSIGDHVALVYAVDDDGNIGASEDLEFTYDGDASEEETVSEAQTDTLIKMTCTEDAEVNDPCKAVYYYADDGTRHAFPNEKVFFSWYEDFDDVIEVSDEFMAGLSLGKNVTYRPGATMVKFQSVPTVYVVTYPKTLQAVASEEVALELYGENWNQYIHDISDAFIGNYTFGEELTSATEYDADAQSALVSSPSDIF